MKAKEITISLCWTLAFGVFAFAEPPDSPAANGKQLLDQAIRRMEFHPRLTARLVQKVDVFGRRFRGSGVYQQGTAGKFSYELRLQVSPNQPPCVLSQVCDGNWVWETVYLAGKQSSRKINLTRFRRQAKVLPGCVAARESFRLGGLPQLLRSLRADFTFSSASSERAEQGIIRVIRGTWNKQALARLLPQQAEAIQAGKPADLSKLEPILPDEVVVALGEDLFPRRIEFLRRSQEESIWTRVIGGKKPEPRRLLTMTFTNVRHGVENEQDFVIPYDDPRFLEAEDRTNPWIVKIRRDPPK
ncbi:MAG: hypothetical protein N2C14_22910 [Planctomycetales bacterium]